MLLTSLDIRGTLASLSCVSYKVAHVAGVRFKLHAVCNLIIRAGEELLRNEQRRSLSFRLTSIGISFVVNSFPNYIIPISMLC